MCALFSCLQEGRLSNVHVSSKNFASTIRPMPLATQAIPCVLLWTSNLSCPPSLHHSLSLSRALSYLPLLLPTFVSCCAGFDALLLLAFFAPQKVSAECFPGDRLRGHAGERFLGRLFRVLRLPPPCHGEVSEAVFQQGTAVSRAVFFSGCGLHNVPAGITLSAAVASQFFCSSYSSDRNKEVTTVAS